MQRQLRVPKREEYCIESGRCYEPVGDEIVEPRKEAKVVIHPLAGVARLTAVVRRSTAGSRSGKAAHAARGAACVLPVHSRL